ncbi:hypothetical protein A2130_03720 [Candidatus Woesebacteria bacterium GWC2_33_12]|uniref:Uncharacterized protein n=1 Tax=Candidatus Woesebacteria bacterium GW2011_GWB1_33_22 TaxID=1618566 RepID=A0A0F9ZMS7_9BACT|nr:MAG: hypothetical protein UR29_C0001G0064 [Candidatus Woesebacteria bacterium GW2011_GWC2_33_12]KKP42726.1 MAG: hypothetical protein UR33_C0001G0087 [Candidatus Woesebacteria bacterium GW2011_GWA2_33_20]KKP45499.1 MAG: hypothetical protein UR35_C0001G0096 [Candidatus Woesebacteria bacterium GW2011_GWB1_33_22]KKP47371.1 MAG: hypothetical protein UR37_C0001G0064 [Microgenomates group bacterium GW2011_GWC1_33_28]KKP51117.1 MAG: hypothetical protein UR41_C0001G0064 [Candidatus Woesebacteria bact
MKKVKKCDFQIEGEWGSRHQLCSCVGKEGEEGNCLKQQIAEGKVKLVKGHGPYDEVCEGRCLQEQIKRRTQEG